MIQDHPPKIYHEPVPFSPSSSWLHEWYSPELLQGVKVAKGLQAGWGTCLRTVSLDVTPSSLACWNDLIVVGLLAGNIITLDATTGICTSTLSGHTKPVKSLAFSSDGTSLVSGSHDKTIKLWDIQTGGVVRTFYGHIDQVSSVSISPDQTTIVSGSLDRTIRLWNTQTGKCNRVIRYEYRVFSISFYPTNPQHLICGSSGTAQRWDTEGNIIRPSYSGSYVAFSSDGEHLILWGAGTATVQCSSSERVITTLQAPGKDYKCFCFSLDGKFVAGAIDNNIYIWFTAGVHPIKTLVGHTNTITSIAFSSILISSSNDGTIRFWQPDFQSTNPVLTDLKSKPLTPTSIMTISVQAKDHTALSSDVAGVVRTWDISTGLCKGSIETSAGPHSHRDIQLIDGRLFVVWCTHKRIYIWDTQKEEHPQKVDTRSDFSTTSLRISGDGSRVFLLDSKYIRALSTQTGEVVGKVRLQGELSDNPLTVDGLRVWVCFKYLQTQGWDFGIPCPTSIGLDNLPLVSPRLEFIYGTIEGSTTHPSRVKDAVTGKEILQLPGRYEGFSKMQCDGQYLVAGYNSGELLILDFGQMIVQ